MKIRRSERLVDMTHFLLSHPQKVIPLTMFAERYRSAKSSISEDLVIIKSTFEDRGIGTLETIAGAAGGVRYIAKADNADTFKFIHSLCNQIANPDRLLAGGYLYLSDLLGDPVTLKAIGRIIATKFNNKPVDVVMTVATKGIPIAQSVAEHLNVPFVVVRRDSKVTEGSTVSINYISGSSKRIEKMELSKRSLKEGANVVIVDDFMKAGGTINGMKDLLDEFGARLVGIGVLVESEYATSRLVDDYVSLVKIKNINLENRQIEVVEGNYFTDISESKTDNGKRITRQSDLNME